MLSVTWVASEYPVGEGDGDITLSLQLNGVVDPTETEVWVSLFLVDNEVATGKSYNLVVISYSVLPYYVLLTEGEDFSSQVDISSLFFPAASVDGQLLPIVFDIDEDLCFEKNHSFTVHISTTEDNVDIGPVNYTTVIIIDNEGKHLRLNLEIYTLFYNLYTCST